MKKVQTISISILVITLLVMGVNIFLSPLPDWVVRINGILLLASLLSVVYTTVKQLKGNP